MSAGRNGEHSWDDLRFFLAVARTGTLTAAAHQMKTEHSTVGRRVNGLEQALGRRLFHRSNTGYALTDAGERLLGAAESMESAFLTASAIREDHVQLSGTVRIAAPDGFGSTFLAPRLHRLTQTHPGLEIEILATARLFSLSRREADIAISLSSPSQSRLVSRRLTDYSLYVYASREYLDRARPIESPKDLKDHHFIGYIEDMVLAKELNYLDEVDRGIATRLRSTNLLAQVNAALAGAGPCVIPHFIASFHPKLVPLFPAQVSLRRSFHMLVHEDNRKAAHIREAAAFIAEETWQARALFLGPEAEESETGA